mmetsp:Transcript_20959/g.44844  ORF Transcript_20959/g.44844 Transcript_20959/m.44844 type:complete len:432 (-) Transcript_20959:47-1342(-)
MNIMKESKKIGKWLFHDSVLSVPPEILLEQNRDDPFIASLLAECGRSLRGIEAASLLLSRIDLLLTDDARKQRDRRGLIRDLAGGADSVRDAISDRGALRRCRESLFGQKVRCATCHPFPPQMVVLVDLSFLPDEFFDPTNPTAQPEINGHYERMIANPKSEVGTFREFMHWGAARNFGCRFRFGGDEGNTDSFVRVLDHFLEEYGGKDPAAAEEGGPAAAAISLRDDWSLGFLSTVLEHMQDPHVDYGHARLAQYRDMAGRRSRNRNGQLLLPWSFDMPLTEGGLRLAFYGIDDPKDPLMLLETPVEMFVPPKHVMLWRGDCIHAGGLLDSLGRSGFRMHGCLPLAPAHRGCGHDSGAKIEWHGPSRAAGRGGEDRCRYSHRLKKLDGTSFEEDDVVRYAADVAQKFGLERTKLWKLREGEASRKRARSS